MKGFINEFKQFISRGSVIDLAVGVIIGGAFGQIVASLVGDVITPLLGWLISDIKFESLYLGPVAIGKFLQATLDFIIIAFVIFLLVKLVNAIRRKQSGDSPTDLPKSEQLLTEIRDLLKAKI